MRTILMSCVLAFFSVTVCLAETSSPMSESRQPTLHDHLKAMEKSQERVKKLSAEDQTEIQPQIRRAELEACEKLNQDREKGLGTAEYRSQGGDQFAAFVMQFEQYCKSLQ